MKLWTLSLLVVGVFLGLLGFSVAQNNTSTTTTTLAPVTTTITPQEECMRNNASCGACLKFAHCLWCFKDNSCKQYPVGHVLPRESDCPLDQARWGVCWVNFKILIIVMSCIGGAILLTISCCCVYCCCCRGDGGRKKLLADESKFTRQKEERKKRSDDKRTERKARTDEIRRKYGLVKDDNPYSRFDADA